MAKKKHSDAELRVAAALEKAEKENDLRRAIGQFMSFDIECAICGHEESRTSFQDSVTTKAEAAQEFKEDGWVYRTSEAFGLIGAHCPDCAKKTDEELREEYA